MPVQVNEIIIKAIIESENNGKSGSYEKASIIATEQLITECVDQVLAILKKQEER